MGIVASSSPSRGPFPMALLEPCATIGLQLGYSEARRVASAKHTVVVSNLFPPFVSLHCTRISFCSTLGYTSQSFASAGGPLGVSFVVVSVTCRPRMSMLFLERSYWFCVDDVNVEVTSNDALTFRGVHYMWCIFSIFACARKLEYMV